jgi:hypothetical protein
MEQQTIMEELKFWLKDNYFALLSQSDTMGFNQAYDTIRLKIQDMIDEQKSKDESIEKLQEVI